MLWAVVPLGKPLSSLTHEDLKQFKAFLVDTQPASRWVLATAASILAAMRAGGPLTGCCHRLASGRRW